MAQVLNECEMYNPALGEVNEFLSNNEGLVRMVCNQFRVSLIKKKIEFEDALQEGLIALYDAYRKFDAAKGCKFSTFAVPCIQTAMLSLLGVEKQKRHQTDQRKVSLNRTLYWYDGVPVSFVDLIGKESDFTKPEVWGFIPYLNQDEKLVLRLLYDGCTRKQIATTLQCPVSAVGRLKLGIIKKYRRYYDDGRLWQSF